MLKRISKTAGILALGLFSLTANANICASLFKNPTLNPTNVLFNLAKNSNPLQQEYNDLSTGNQQVQFIHDKLKNGFVLVEIEVGKHVRLPPTTTSLGEVRILMEYRYYLFDSLENTRVIVDMTQNRFVQKGNFGHQVKSNFKNTFKIVDFFSGTPEKATWTPASLNFISRLKLNISSYPVPGYWKIENEPEFSNYAVGNFYLRAYRDSRTNFKFVDLDRLKLNRSKKSPVGNPYKIRKLDRDL